MLSARETEAEKQQRTVQGQTPVSGAQGRKPFSGNLSEPFFPGFRLKTMQPFFPGPAPWDEAKVSFLLAEISAGCTQAHCTSRGCNHLTSQQGRSSKIYSPANVVPGHPSCLPMASRALTVSKTGSGLPPGQLSSEPGLFPPLGQVCPRGIRLPGNRVTW